MSKDPNYLIIFLVLAIILFYSLYINSSLRCDKLMNTIEDQDQVLILQDEAINRQNQIINIHNSKIIRQNPFFQNDAKKITKQA